MSATREENLEPHPVYAEYFADPFVWKAEGVYYAIGTGKAEANGDTAERVFPMLRSYDFVTWNYLCNALVRPSAVLGNTFWAPEVAEADGHFYLYYSVGFGDKHHQLRVGRGDSPAGPFTDCGVSLLAPDACPFAIDPHPFQDRDGQWYLFYARDFLDCDARTRPGTALMVARMRSMTALEGAGSSVLRARSDWQRFQNPRLMYGRLWDWHTLEGPCARRHQGKYYCFYSGGRWENETYGVDYAVADSVMGVYSDRGNEQGPRVLRTLPNLIGPGHNSIVVGPDGETEYLVYHAWDKHMQARRMFINKLIWTAEGPRCGRGKFLVSCPSPGVA